MNYAMLRQIRKQKGFTIAKLSNITGISCNSLSLIERGIGNPRIKTIELICNSLDVKIMICL